MYIVRDKKSKEIVHKNPAPLEQRLSNEDIYFKFDPKKMEIGKTDGQLPEHYKIDNNGMIAELTLQEKLDEGLFILEPHQKIEGNEIVDKTLAEKVAEGLIEVTPNQKIIDEEIVEKSLQEMLDEKLITLDEIKERKVDELSSHSLSLRNEILPDYKIQNALLGIYDDTKTEQYKKTINAFRGEFHRLKEEIQKARTLKALEAVRGNFPDKIVADNKISSSKKKVVKRNVVNKKVAKKKAVKKKG